VTSSATHHLMGEATVGARKVPISLLSGFLGSGKTTLLREVLHNKGGLKVGVVVNDVANVNIDAKLVRERSSSGIQTKSGEGVEFVELENGCACCDAAGELLACIEHLLEIAQVGGYEYDRIIIEMSGVAEPRNVRAEFHEAMSEGHPVFDRSELSSMITVVDSPHFFRLYSSKNDVADHEELLGREEQRVETYDAMKWVEVERKVVDLLTEQVECADMVVINKVDAVEKEADVGALRAIVGALNPTAQLFECSYGKVPMHDIFGRDKGKIGLSDDDEDIRSAVRAAREAEAQSAGGHGGHGHSHSHGHTHGHTHGHSHAHAHAHVREVDLPATGYQASDAQGEPHTQPSGVDLNLQAVWLHTAVDTLGSAIVLAAGLLTVWGGMPQADYWGGIIIVMLVWATTLPLVLQIHRRLFPPRFPVRKAKECAHEKKALLG